jgi:hypothetical protein
VAEHPTTTTTPAAAAHLVPVGEEIAAAMPTTERPAAGVALVVALVTPFAAVTERMAMMVLMHGMEKEMAQAHDELRYISRLFYDIS